MLKHHESTSAINCITHKVAVLEMQCIEERNKNFCYLFKFFPRKYLLHAVSCFFVAFQLFSAMFPDDRRFVLALVFRQTCKSHFLHRAISCIDMFCAGQDMSERSSWIMSLLRCGRIFRQKVPAAVESWISIICANWIVRHDPKHDLQWFWSETRTARDANRIIFLISLLHWNRFFQIICKCNWQWLQIVPKLSFVRMEQPFVSWLSCQQKNVWDKN